MWRACVKSGNGVSFMAVMFSYRSGMLVTVLHTCKQYSNTARMRKLSSAAATAAAAAAAAAMVATNNQLDGVMPGLADGAGVGVMGGGTGTGAARMVSTA
jgi:hypothetical protein